MRILVTGGAGFIGSNFVRRVISNAYPNLADAEVVVLDKLTYAGSMENLAPVADHPRLRFVHGDICDPDVVESALQGVSVIVHCAAETHVDRSIENGIDFVRSNIAGTFNLLERSLEAGIDKFVLVSTDEVYGTVDVGSWDENEPLMPNSPYSATKGAADLIARAFCKTYGMPVCITRSANNYGPHQFPEKLISLFITNLLSGERLPLYGDGSNVREWVHVDDHCAGIALVADRGEPGEVYNIGGETELTNAEVTSIILDELGHEWSMVRNVADRKGHDQRYSIDDSKIRRQLGYRPQVPFREGIRATARWYLENRDWWEPLRDRTGDAVRGGPAARP